MTTPTVDTEFQCLIPPLSEDEHRQLESNLVTEGCRDALVVWAGQGVLLDGHNRFEICERLGLQYCTTEIELPDRDAAKDWIDANQLGRRNLTADAFKLLLGRRYLRSKRQGHRKDLTSPQIEEKLTTAEQLGAQYGVSRGTVERAGKFAAQVERDPELQQAIHEAKPVVQLKRERKEREREQRREKDREKIQAAKSMDQAVKDARFATILIDPPWQYGDEGDMDIYGRGRPTYETMPIEKIRELPVGERADDDCHIYMWITNRSIPKGADLLESWGFRYITCLTWMKARFGLGNYFRGQTEHVMFGVKGSQPLKRKDVGTWFEGDPGPRGHSSKPEAFYDLVESCSPGPYLEIFARGEREGWTTWGGEL